MGCIYKIVNTETEKIYIGSAKDIGVRLDRHFSLLENEKHYNSYLQAAWNKYGSDCFEVDIIEDGVEIENLRSVEQEYIDEIEPFDENGYNLARNANGGDTLTNHPDYDEIMKKWSEAHMGEKNWKYGTTVPEKTKRKISESLKGKNNPMYNQKHDEETRKKMKKAAEGRYTLEWFIDRYGETEGRKKYKERNEQLRKRMKENNPMDNPEYRKRVSEGLKGKSKSEEHKRKIAEARKGKATGPDNPNYVHVPESELKQKIGEGLKSKELADHFDTSQNTITRKIKKYWNGIGLMEARRRFSN